MTKDVRSEAGSGKSETNVDVSFSGKIQLNSSGLYANLEKIIVDMMPNDVYDTKSFFPPKCTYFAEKPMKTGCCMDFCLVV